MRWVPSFTQSSARPPDRCGVLSRGLLLEPQQAIRRAVLGGAGSRACFHPASVFDFHISYGLLGENPASLFGEWRVCCKHQTRNSLLRVGEGVNLIPGGAYHPRASSGLFDGVMDRVIYLIDGVGVNKKIYERRQIWGPRGVYWESILVSFKP